MRKKILHFLAKLINGGIINIILLISKIL